MLNYAETARGSTDSGHQQAHSREPLPKVAEPQGREPGLGTVTFRKAVIVTNNADGFLVVIECGQACYIEEDHPVTSTVLVDLFAEVIDHDDDLSEGYPIGFIVGFLDALFRDRKTYPLGWWE